MKKVALGFWNGAFFWRLAGLAIEATFGPFAEVMEATD